MKKFLCVCMALFMLFCGSSCFAFLLLFADDPCPEGPSLVLDRDYTYTYNGEKYYSTSSLQNDVRFNDFELYGPSKVVAKTPINASYIPVSVSPYDEEQNMLWEGFLSLRLLAYKEGTVLPAIEDAPLKRLFLETGWHYSEEYHEVTVIEGIESVFYITDILDVASFCTELPEENAERYQCKYMFDEYEYLTWRAYIWNVDGEYYCSFSPYRWENSRGLKHGYYKIKPEYHDALRNAFEELNSLNQQN